MQFSAFIVCSVYTCLTFFLQVPLPTNITGRYGPSAVVFGTGPDCRVVVLFGGRAKDYYGSVMSETTMLILSKWLSKITYMYTVWDTI